jgi:hypothetical protein
VLLEPRDNVREFKDGAIARAHWVLEGLEGDGAEIVGESPEGNGGFGGEAGGGAKRVGPTPLAVGSWEIVSWDWQEK